MCQYICNPMGVVRYLTCLEQQIVSTYYRSVTHGAWRVEKRFVGGLWSSGELATRRARARVGVRVRNEAERKENCTCCRE